MLDNWFSKKTHDKARPTEHGRARPAVVAEPSQNAISRRQQRMERRELLYAVVREAMVRAGVLSASYSFKVLSLESQGRQYLIMVDLARGFAQETRQQSEIEKQIIHNAKARHDILVTAIYWRFNERLKSVARNTAAVPGRSWAPGFEPIGEDEVAALRQALAVGMAAAQSSGFEDTEVIVAQDPFPALSQTQYGHLN
jgi:hypothetical protein